jgi:hypothetical protein
VLKYATIIIANLPSAVNVLDKSGRPAHSWSVFVSGAFNGFNLLRMGVKQTDLGKNFTWKRIDPWLAVIFQVTPIAPPVGTLIAIGQASDNEASDDVGFCATMFTRFVGILNPLSVAMNAKDKEAAYLLMGAATFCTVVQSELLLDTAAMLLADK